MSKPGASVGAGRLDYMTVRPVGVITNPRFPPCSRARARTAMINTHTVDGGNLINWFVRTARPSRRFLALQSSLPCEESYAKNIT